MNDGVYENVAALPEAQARALFAQLRRDPATARKLELSFAQRRVWFLQQTAPGSPAFNLPEAFRLTGPVDPVALQAALRRVVERHDVLRSRFPHPGGAPVRLESATPVSLDVVTPEVPAGESADATAHRLAEEEAGRAFDLAVDPLIRCRLFVLAPGDHVLTVTAHHIVADGLSLAILFRELSAFYAEFSGGAPAGLPEPKGRYAQYIAHQRAATTGEELERELDFWRTTLAGAPGSLDLPTDTARPVRQGLVGGLLRRPVPAEVMRGLRELAGRERASLFMTLLAAYAVLLYRFSGQDDILIGTPVAGRDSTTDDLIGLFVNTTVIRVDLAGNPSFAELVRRVRAAALDVYAHADLPHDLLVEHLRPPRDPSRNPLFQSFFAYEHGQATLAGLGATPATRIEVDTRISARFDLSLAVAESDEGATQAKLGFPTDLFQDSTITALLDAYRHLLAAVVADPDAPIDTVALLAAEDRAALLERWTADRALEHIARPTLHALVERQARRTPEAVALARGQERLSYAELDAEANRLAHVLRARDIGVGSVVGVALERRPRLVVTLLAVLKTGAAYLAIDPHYPLERSRFMLADSGTSLLVTEDRHAAAFEGWAGPLLRVEEVAEEAAGRPPTPPAATGAGEDLAYLVYTSGSTGQPKGIAVEHRGVVNLVEARATVYGAEQFRVTYASSSISFDSSVSELFVALTTGGAVVLADTLLDLVDTAPALPVTMLETVPSLLRELLRRTAPPPSVRAVCLGGEALPADLVEALYATGTVQRVYNTYGPTEATVSATRALVPRGATRPTIGRPIPGVRTYVLDGGGHPVPAGLPGELHIAGVGVARGYLGRPQLTARHFLPDPFVPGARMYRTGDLVRELPDGALDWLGRTDRQVKIRGVRVEPGEIEQALLRQPGVTAAAVVARPDGAGAELCAYVVADPAPDPAALRAGLRTVVPAFLVPTVFVTLDRLPLTPSGKLDVAGLPSPPAHDPVAYRAPTTATETAIAAIWADLLDQRTIGARDDFFALGGHSLLGIQAVYGIERSLGVRVDVATLFEAPTVESLAEAVDTLIWARDSTGPGEGHQVGEL
ncbi:amino acid adenylation domain-containing protein [Streptomyces sp. NPDC057702]|uniref:amino acid adenylation domain-containing protein n=1 Tax=unclassified Streptomyces TaxID=2593676 RepID=UPI0036773E08